MLKPQDYFQVIQRKLVSILTPSTTAEDNIGPDAVHLLAIKEVGLKLQLFILMLVYLWNLFNYLLRKCDILSCVVA